MPAAKATATSPAHPEYCDAQGMIAPQTHFDLQLPVSTWQGRYLQNGCGGYCGSVGTQQFPSCDATLGGDFAMATDDEGHVTAGGLGGGGLFAFNDQKLRNEYGYESEQALYEVSREIIKDYYGVYPDESYYNGCSDGGREAMEMAERYPDDFNGIIAGAPEIIAGPLNAENQTWDVRVNTDANGNAILTDTQLTPLHDAVLAKCAGDDGTNDGIITDPQACSLHLNQILQSVQCPEDKVHAVPDAGPGNGRPQDLRRTERPPGAPAVSGRHAARVRSRVDRVRAASAQPERPQRARANDAVARLLRTVAAVPALPAESTGTARSRPVPVAVHRPGLQLDVPGGGHGRRDGHQPGARSGRTGAS